MRCSELKIFQELIELSEHLLRSTGAKELGRLRHNRLIVLHFNFILILNLIGIVSIFFVQNRISSGNFNSGVDLRSLSSLLLLFQFNSLVHLLFAACEFSNNLHFGSFSSLKPRMSKHLWHRQPLLWVEFCHIDEQIFKLVRKSHLVAFFKLLPKKVSSVSSKHPINSIFNVSAIERHSLCQRYKENYRRSKQIHRFT